MRGLCGTKSTFGWRVYLGFEMKCLFGIRASLIYPELVQSLCRRRGRWHRVGGTPNRRASVLSRQRSRAHAWYRLWGLLLGFLISALSFRFSLEGSSSGRDTFELVWFLFALFDALVHVFFFPFLPQFQIWWNFFKSLVKHLAGCHVETSHPASSRAILSGVSWILLDRLRHLE